MDIQIRQGTREHLEECKEALRNSKLGEVYFSDETKALRAILEFVDAGALLVAINRDNSCVGFLGYIPKGAFHHYPYIHFLAVREYYRSSGVGRTLMEYFHQMLSGQSSKVFLVVADFNPRAKLFYEKLGYGMVGSIPSLYKEGVTENLMMKELG